VSLCMIAYNEAEAIEGLFSDISLQEYPHEKIEIVFVDSMSTDSTYERHHTDCLHIFLHGIVEVVVALKHLCKEFHGLTDDEIEGCAKNHKCHHEDKTHLRVDKDTHEDTEYQVERCTNRNAKNLLKSTLQIRHISRHAGDKSCGRELVDIGKGKSLDIAKHGISQIIGKARGSQSRKASRQNAKHQRDERQNQHDDAIEHHLTDVACHDSTVDNPRRDVRNEHTHHYFQGSEDGCENRSCLKLLNLI
ncbi:MAG: glycosyltransferase, partial [Bacteroidaceae bacterium]|nr:glycosyltransferase [Bacteroidaceae bacterium]